MRLLGQVRTRTATVADLASVTCLLANAFVDDPVMSWAFPHPQRHDRLTALYGLMAERLYLPLGQSTIAEDAAGRPVGAALWKTAGFEGDAQQDEAFWEANGNDFAVALEGEVQRIVEFSALSHEHHPHVDHRYLLASGTSSGLARDDVDAALGSHTVEQLRAEGVNGYLEASSLRSRARYASWGFEVISEFALDGAPPTWGMWFQADEHPRPTSSAASGTILQRSTRHSALV